MIENERMNPFPTADAEGCVSRNVKRIAHVDLPGGAQIVSRNGVIFIGHMSPPLGTSIMDVSDPQNPSLLNTLELPDDQSHSHKVVVCGDLMLINNQRDRRKFYRKGENLFGIRKALTQQLGRSATDTELANKLGVNAKDLELLLEGINRGYQTGGFRIFDISTPANPRQIGFQHTGGDGAHGFDFDGRYAYVSTEVQGFRGNILENYDLSDPENPQAVSQWHLPGQEAPDSRVTSPIGGNWIHHALRVNDTLWAAGCQAGVFAIDISDISNPVTLGSYNYHPPFIEPTHTAMALPQKFRERDLALVIDEEHGNHPRGQPHAALWVFDVTKPGAMKPLSVFEVSELESPWSRSGQSFGASQIVEHPTGDLVFATWFAGGLRIVDISNPTTPTEVGCFIPPPAAGFRAPQSMDAEVDDRGIIYLLDKNHGLDILELTL